MAHLLVGSLAHSGRWRGYLSPVMDQPHLAEGLDRVCRGLGGITKQWRFDRMATVCQPGSGRVTATFSGVAKHYLLTELANVAAVSSLAPLLDLRACRVSSMNGRMILR